MEEVCVQNTLLLSHNIKRHPFSRALWTCWLRAGPRVVSHSQHTSPGEVFEELPSQPKSLLSQSLQSPAPPLPDDMLGSDMNPCCGPTGSSEKSQMGKEVP